MDRERSPRRGYDDPAPEQRHGGGRGHPERWPEDRQMPGLRGRGRAEAEERMRRAQADFDYRADDDRRWDDRRYGAERYSQEYGPGWYDAHDYRGDARYPTSGSAGDNYFSDPGWGAREQDFRDRPGERGGEHRGRGPAGYRRSDERIREDVSDRLTDDPYLDASGVQVRVSDCEVTLDGTVDSRYAKRRAESLSEHVSGVSHVQNNLRIKVAEDMKAAPVASPISGKKGH